MTTFEALKDQYDKKYDYAKTLFTTTVPGSIKFVALMCKNQLMGTMPIDNYLNIEGVEDAKDMIDKGFLKVWVDSSTEARRKNVVQKATITTEGLKMFYKTMFLMR